ncbi:hypothetical protein Patl1_31438 [Pistacia atlantica]|uniref:Uncharacterized protein n=1 Tax=Pistacia atlantica TaxID=434234 RepID=A0ACC1ALQ9_9ROSI|nr:hypothetical protein Patl1_31438 [Pistacia atlantica]
MHWKFCGFSSSPGIFKSEVNMDKSSPRGNQDWHWYMKSLELAGEGDLKYFPKENKQSS